jgi:hypothetical protein
MADSEPIIIHGTPTTINITSGSAVTTIKRHKTEPPFSHVMVVIDGKETETISTEDLEKKWEIRIHAVKPPIQDT